MKAAAEENRPAQEERILLAEGRGVDPGTGLMLRRNGRAADPVPVRLAAGTVVSPVPENTEYRLFFYTDEVDRRYIDTYCYAPEGNWASYRPEPSLAAWRRGRTVLEETGWYRFELRAESVPEGGNFAVAADRSACVPEQPAPWIAREAERLAERAEASGREGLRFFLLADTHHTAGDIWPDTLRSLELSAARLRPEFLVHLGDLTDGMYELSQTKQLAAEVLAGLRGVCRQVFLCLGNHDENYFRGNAAVMDKKQSAEFYLGSSRPYGCTDLPEHRLRLFFLDSFDPRRKQRYGFSLKEYLWFRRRLKDTPEGYRILVFSHVPPHPEIHVWSDRIRLGPQMLGLLERYGRQRGRRVLGWIHGHSHADQVWRGAGVPVIGIGCGKLECFPEYKPKGSCVSARQRGTASQELWDAAVIPDGEDCVLLFRYGAGEDRRIVPEETEAAAE